MLIKITLKSVAETDQYKGMRVKLLKETVEASEGVKLMTDRLQVRHTTEPICLLAVLRSNTNLNVELTSC